MFSDGIGAHTCDNAIGEHIQTYCTFNLGAGVSPTYRITYNCPSLSI